MNRARRTNWAGNLTFDPADFAAPTSADELAVVVGAASAAGRHVNCLGTGHCFSDLGATDGLLVSTLGLDDIGPLDGDVELGHGTVWVGAGVRIADLCSWLAARGAALHNLPSLPHITIGGAIATATHGSGDANGNLSSAVVALDLVTADGKTRRFDRDGEGDPRLDGVVVSLGALGVVARLQMRVRPAFDIEQRVWTGIPFDVAAAAVDEVLGAAYSVSLFTRWRGEIDQLWVKSLVAHEPALDPAALGAVAAAVAMHPVDGDAASCTEQLGAPGPSTDRLTHFRFGFVPSAGAELQSELFVARQHATEAMVALADVADGFADAVLVSEIRSVAADDLWLSTASGADVVGLHFTWRPDVTVVERALAVVESALAPFAPRPHWGKLTGFTASDIRPRYARMTEFDELRAELDPDGTFANPAVERLLVAD